MVNFIKCSRQFQKKQVLLAYLDQLAVSMLLPNCSDSVRLCLIKYLVRSKEMSLSITLDTNVRFETGV